MMVVPCQNPLGIQTLCSAERMMGKRISCCARLRRLLGPTFATAALSLSTSSLLLQTDRVAAFNPSAPQAFVHPNPSFRLSRSIRKSPWRMFASETATIVEEGLMDSETWNDVLPMEKGSHNSAKISVPPQKESKDDPFGKTAFRERLESTVTACREMGKSSLWVEVPMSRAGLIEDMVDLGLRFHHAAGETAVLNIWLRGGESKVPEYATHNVGVGAVVVNSRDEILCVRELRKNYMPWKTPTGLSELGEQIDEAAVREVMEETGIKTEFHSLLSFRQTHGLAHGRSDLFFVCRLDPIEDVDDDGSVIIPDPVPQEDEIAKAEWVPLSEYREMVKGEPGHPMMSHVIDVLDAERRIEKRVVNSIVPGRKPNAIFLPNVNEEAKSS